MNRNLVMYASRLATVISFPKSQNLAASRSMAKKSHDDAPFLFVIASKLQQATSLSSSCPHCNGIENDPSLASCSSFFP